MSELLLLFFFLVFIKHFVMDFLLQPAWMHLNKGNLLHPGGYAHSGLHALSTFTILVFVFQPVLLELCLALSLFEFVVHYLVDYAKVNITKAQRWTPAMPEFWYALGFDQLLHYLTYFGIALYIFGVYK